MRTPTWILHTISDADEPGDHLFSGMRHRDFEGVTTCLIPDGDPGDMGGYGTDNLPDGRPTRPILVFYNGTPPSDEDVDRCLASDCDKRNIPPTDYTQDTFSAHDLPFVEATIEVPLSYPPYPWESEARLGMQMGRYFDHVELIDWTDAEDDQPAIYRYRFSRSDASAQD